MTDAPVPSLRKAALSGARWTALGRVAVETVTFAAAIALARLIEPSGFGTAAVALIVVSLAAVLGTAGVVAPLVQRPQILADHVASAAFLVLCSGVVMSALTAAFAVTLGPSVFGESTSDLLALSGLAWLLVALGATSQALLQRELRFRLVAGIEIASAVAGIVVSLTSAALGLEGGALVLGALGLVGTTSILSLMAERPPLPIPTRRALNDIYRFAGAVTASSLVFLAYRNVDYAILGARASSTQVGLYWRAYQLGVAYQGKISRVMLRVSFPILSRATTLDEIRQLRMRIVRTHATVLVPMLATLIGVAPVLIPWLFGATWEPAVALAQIMAVAGMADAVTTGVGPLMIAVGRPRELLVWNVVQLVLFAGLVFVLSSHGTTVLASGVAAFGVFNVLAIQVGLLRPYVGLSFAQLWRDVRAGCAGGAAALAATVGVRVLLEGELPTIMLLALLGVTAVVAVWLVLRVAFPAEEADVRRILRRRP